MRVAVRDCFLELHQGNIVRQEVDLIVNAANPFLAGGGGVDGAIHLYGGPAIMEETDRRYPEGCPTGSAVISIAGDLTARYVAHAVGPRWQDGTADEPRLLASAYQCSFELAIAHECRSMALPALSTGVYGYPLRPAAQIALSTAIDFLHANDRPELVRFVLFTREHFETFAEVLSELLPVPRITPPA